MVHQHKKLDGYGSKGDDGSGNGSKAFPLWSHPCAAKRMTLDDDDEVAISFCG